MKSGSPNILEPSGPVQGLPCILPNRVTQSTEGGVGESSRCAAWLINVKGMAVVARVKPSEQECRYI